MKKCLVINNPFSGKQLMGNLESQVCERLRIYDYDALYLNTKNKGDITRYAKSDGYDLYIIIGGDGTLSEGLGAFVNTDKSVGYIPNGTTNDFGRMHEYPMGVKNSIDQLMIGEEREVDILDLNGKPVVYVVAGGHPITTVPYQTSSKAKKIFGRAAYINGGIRELLQDVKSYEYEYEINGEKEKGEASIFIVSNSTSVAGLPLYKRGRIRLDDGKFEVLIVDSKEKGDLISKVFRAVRGDVTQMKGDIKYFQTDNFKINFNEPLEHNICLDGDKYTENQKSFEVKTMGRVKMLLPVSSKKIFTE